VATFRAEDQWWSDDIDFTFNGMRFARKGLWDGNTDAGSWSLDGNTLSLMWDRWATTALTTSDHGRTFTASSGLTLSIDDPPDWWLELFNVCKYRVVFSSNYGLGGVVEFMGPPGDSFHIESCARLDEFCSSNGWGEGFNMIANQEGTLVADGNCCSETNTIESVSSSCTGDVAAMAAQQTGILATGQAGTLSILVAVMGTSGLLLAAAKCLRKKGNKLELCRGCDAKACYGNQQPSFDSTPLADIAVKDARNSDEENSDVSILVEELDEDQSELDMDLLDQWEVDDVVNADEFGFDERRMEVMDTPLDSHQSDTSFGWGRNFQEDEELDFQVENSFQSDNSFGWGGSIPSDNDADNRLFSKQTAGSSASVGSPRDSTLLHGIDNFVDAKSEWGNSSESDFGSEDLEIMIDHQDLVIDVPPATCPNFRINDIEGIGGDSSPHSGGATRASGGIPLNDAVEI
jgi:hypothetical protein